jgi:fibronectin type 3 domain-containing protein
MRGRAAIRPTARALLVSLVAIAIITALPMSSPPAQGARSVYCFDDGAREKVVTWLTAPTPGEMTTFYLSIKADVTVVSATMSVAGVLFGQSFSATGTGNVGTKVDASGDIDGDGYDDMVVTAPEAGTSVSGQIYVLPGTATGPSLPATYTLSGAASDRLGYGLSCGGDVNGDGYDDVVGGGPQVTGGGVFVGPGVAKVFYGAASNMNLTPAVTLSEGNDEDYFGWSISTSGDVNNDGYDDIVVGAPQLDSTTDTGIVYLFLGSSSGPSTTPDVTITGAVGGDFFGNSVAIAGDINKDGHDDVLVGAPGANGTNAADWDLGRLYVFYGTDTGISTSPDWTCWGGVAGDSLGQCVARAGDVNGDGYYDIMGGAPFKRVNGQSNAGEAYVFYGGATGPSSTADVTMKGQAVDELLGYSLAGIGDANNDGYDDVDVAAPQAANGGTAGAGYFQVHMGGANGLSKSPGTTIRGTSQGEFLGRLMGPGGDVNGDGCSDLCSGNWPNTIAAHLYYGEPGPKGPKVYVDQTLVWSKTGAFGAADEVPDFTTLVNNYLAAHQADVDGNGNISIPVNVTSAGAGRLRLFNVNLLFYKLNTPAGLKATPVARGNAITLSWDAQIGDDTSALALEVWNGTGWQEMAKIPRLNVSHTLDGLTDGVEYEFRIKAYDGGVQRYSGPSASVKVTPRDTLPPAKIANMSFKENRTAMGVNVSWNPSDSDSVHYEVWSNKSGAWAPIANVSAPDHWFIDTSIDDGPRYYYRVRAWDEVPLAGEFSNVIWALLLDKTPPAAPSNLQLVPLPEGNGLTLSWDLNTDDTVAYFVQSNKTGDWREITRLGRSGSTFTDRGLVNGVSYHYRVSAIDESNNPSAPSAAVVGVPRDTVPPAVPQTITVEQRPVGNMLRVLWLPNTDDTERYRVYIYNATAAEWQAVGDVLASFSQFDVAKLVDGQSYRFRVTAIDDAGLESAPGEEAAGVPRDTMYPTIPVGLRVMPVPEGKALNVSWSTNFDDTVSFKLYRLEAGSWVLVATRPADRTWYLDEGLLNNIPYAYAVTSTDEADNESPNSERKEGTPVDTVPPARPLFSDLPVKTQFKDVTVAGTCEPLAKVTLHVNKISLAPVDCDASGHFSAQVRLRSGSNEVYAVADDGSGYTTESVRETVFVDETAPGVLQTNPISGETSVEREGLVVEVVFTEDIVPGELTMMLVKGKQTDPARILTLLAGGDAVPATMLSYMRTDLRATFNVTKLLDKSATYTVVLRGVKDIAGNSMTTEGGLGLYYFSFTTVSTGPVTPVDGGGGNGVSGVVLAGIGVVILIVIAIIVAVFIMRAGAKGETIVLDKEATSAHKRELTAEETRPDVQDLYKTAYEERGEPSEHHEVDAGLGTWLAEQEKTSQLAEEDSKRLVQELAKRPKPPASSGPIEELPPGYVKESPSEGAEGAEGAEGSDEGDGKGA